MSKTLNTALILWHKLEGFPQFALILFEDLKSWSIRVNSPCVSLIRVKIVRH